MRSLTPTGANKAERVNQQLGSLSLTGDNRAWRTNQPPLFSSGLELADVVVNSDLLRHCWDAIWGLHREINSNGETRILPFSLKYEVSQLPEFTIIAFSTSPTCTRDHLHGGEKDLVSSAALKETFPLFEFLLTKGSFSIHKVAITLLASLHEELSELKDKYENAAPLIITGHSLGGSIASLFTLWLLGSVSRSATKQPLCITFGAPLIGDNGLQQAILERLTWNSCFLHVVANQDPVPRLFIAPHITDYKPFGTFLMCSDFGSTCIEDPLAVSELLLATGSGSGVNQVIPGPGEWRIGDYGSVVEHLKSRMWLKGISQLDEATMTSLRAAIILQLDAIGIRGSQQTSAVNTLIEKMEKWEEASAREKRFLDPTKKLNEVKITMALLEWYKKKSKDNNVGYYDSYKNRGSRADWDVARRKRVLTNYWKKKVEEAEKRPQKEGSSLRKRWLFAGTNYRRMVEPLDIAEYYGEKGQKDYKTKARSRHYILLAKWLEEEANKPEDSPNLVKKQNVEAILTEDSCFWANVEEAIISCRLLKDEETSDLAKELSRESLIEFEKYVMKLIKNYDVSPEIFLSKSTFMQWWKEYEGLTMRTSYDLPLTDFMKTGKFKEYSSGCL
ncbi:putative Senescence-associated [Tripterygium wilfordii]|uniref:Putative Senescence-associated n=1 Tax=Tripterygium wilfordii TaxID=458696 RepID=A0A7J7DL92_TRIWF|nr:senescence-associated carboxylesterase 101 [Tripterygium wilfordii]KAF5746856.1 putative Senescence-associated [Tripterygium wilfordii]